jgi:hypothetical protein
VAADLYAVTGHGAVVVYNDDTTTFQAFMNEGEDVKVTSLSFVDATSMLITDRARDEVLLVDIDGNTIRTFASVFSPIGVVCLQEAGTVAVISDVVTQDPEVLFFPLGGNRTLSMSDAVAVKVSSIAQIALLSYGSGGDVVLSIGLRRISKEADGHGVAVIASRSGSGASIAFRVCTPGWVGACGYDTQVMLPLGSTSFDARVELIALDEQHFLVLEAGALKSCEYGSSSHSCVLFAISPEGEEWSPTSMAYNKLKGIV